MIEDAEMQLYKDVAELRKKVPELEKRIESLGKRVLRNSKRLSTGAGDIDIQLLEDQIISIEKNLLTLSRFVADFDIEEWENHLKKALYEQFPGQDAPVYAEARNYVITNIAAAREKIKKSGKPLKEVQGFLDECSEYFRQNGLSGFAG
jgi:hypothetical protein